MYKDYGEYIEYLGKQIPKNEDNRDFRKFQEWVKKGNLPQDMGGLITERNNKEFNSQVLSEMREADISVIESLCVSIDNIAAFLTFDDHDPNGLTKIRQYLTDQTARRAKLR